MLGTTVRIVAAEDPETCKQGRRQARTARAALSFFALRPWEWVVVGVVASAVVIVNKAVIHDRGSSWGSLLMVSFYAGVAVTHAARWVWRRH